MELRYKFTLFALLCSILPLLGISSLAFEAARKSLREVVEIDLTAIAEREIESVQNILSDTTGHLTTWSRLGIMQDVLTDDASKDLYSELMRFAERYDIFTDLMVLNEIGVVVAATKQSMIETSLSDSPQFLTSLEGLSYRSLVTTSDQIGQEVIILSEPIVASYDEETVIGVLVGLLDWQKVKDGLAERVLFGGKQNQQRRLIFQSISDGSNLYATDNLTHPDNLSEHLAMDTDVREVKLHDSEYVVASVRSSLSESLDDPLWIVHVALDTDVAYASVSQLRRYLAIVGIAVLFLVTLLAFVFARSIVRPINALVVDAQKLAAGDFSTRLQAYAGDEIGKLARSFIVMRDAVQSNEKELIKRTEISEQAARLKGEFLANMSHEVRTPINGILGMTELMLSTELTDKQLRYASTIMRSGQSLLHVINDILDFSKIEARKLELQNCAFDLRELVEDVVEMLAEGAHRKGLELSVHFAPESHVAYQGDPARLRQILINLLSNAIKFTSDGEVTLHVVPQGLTQDAEGTIKSEISVAQASDAVVPDETVRFEISDTGIGIPADSQAAIFDSFVQADGSTTRRFGGTGLGLAISTSLVELMGGRISVESEEGVGSTFRFVARLGRLSESVGVIWRDINALQGRRILIVDDNKTNRDILTAQTTFWGSENQAVSNGNDALQALRTASTEGHAFDLAILDMQMPGMDGLALAEAIKQDPIISQTKLSLLSSVNDQLNAEEYRAIGIEAMLTKPVRQPDLFRCLTALMTLGVQTAATAAPVKRLALPALCGHILLAEDHPVNQDMMCEMLRIFGLSITVVENGRLAVEKLAQGQFDLVLMDCQMPVMDGFEATTEIRSREDTEQLVGRTPIIALTANALQGDREACLAIGMDDYLSKPISSAGLHAMLEKWLSTGTTIQPNEESASFASSDTTLAAAPELAANDSDSQIATSSLDEKVFGSVLSMCIEASPGFLDRLVSTYVENSATDLKLIDTAQTERQSEVLGKRAHRLKSSSANMGALQLAALCQQVESAAKNGQLDDVNPLLDALREEHQQVTIALKAQCAKAA